jgi:hypothetical protein
LDDDHEMALAAFAGAGVASMAVGFVDDLKARGRQAEGKLSPDRLGDLTHISPPFLCACQFLNGGPCAA